MTKPTKEAALRVMRESAEALPRATRKTAEVALDRREALDAVERAYRAEREAQARKRAAVLRARELGLSFPKIAEAAGVSHPAIIAMVRRST